MSDGIAIKKDITVEAKATMHNAMSGFVSDDYKKMAYLRERKWFWLDNGCTETEAIDKANSDYEWLK